MHIRESQNAIVARAINEAALRLPVAHKIAERAAGTSPVAAQAAANVLRAGVQPMGDALLGH